MLSPVLSSSRSLMRTMLIVGLGLGVATLIAVLTLTHGAREQLNAEAAARQKSRLSAALAQRSLDARTDLAALTSGRSARSDAPAEAPSVDPALGTLALNLFGFSELYILDQRQRFVGGFVGSRPATAEALDLHRGYAERMLSTVLRNIVTADGRLTGLASPAYEIETGLSALVHDGIALVRITIVPLRITQGRGLPPHVGPLLVMGVQEMTEAGLRSIAERQGLGQLRVMAALPDSAAQSWLLPTISNAPAAYLVWHPDRPGDAMFTEFATAMTIAMVFVSLLFMLAMLRMKSATNVLSQREQLIERLAGFDALSNLPNRRSFDHTLDQNLASMARTGGGLAVMMLDLDRFKAVNDTFGHKAGDDLICKVARRLTELLRSTDTLARFGGDEFAIIQSNVATHQDAAILANRILDCIRRPFTIGEHEVSVGVSIGIALAPADAMQRDGLMHLADTALYQAKNEGRNRYSFFDRTMDRSLHLRRLVAEDLRSAIERNELTLAFQPQVSSDGMRMHGVEALVRWNHPTQGFIPPAEFIPIAEERGLIMPLSHWVMREACRAARAWPDLKLAVNVSPVEFRNKDFVASVAAILAETGFDPARLELELTEGVLVEDADAAEEAMMELRALGCSLALDDFGTGYSSLIYLRRFAFDKIKIDRSFLDCLETTGESAILVHSVVHLGRALGLKVCAEGVETDEQHRFLQSVGCHELQGYFFSRPVAASAITELLASGREIRAAA